MYRCKSCGTEIDEYQYKNFNGNCPDCIRISKAPQKPAVGKALQLQATISERLENQSYMSVFSIIIMLGAMIFIFILGIGVIYYNTVIQDKPHNVPWGISFLIGGTIVFILGLILRIYKGKYKAKTEELKKELNNI